MASKIIIYSKDHCPYCVRAKSLLTAKKLQFTEIDITNNETLRDECFAKSNGRKTVPQIFIGSTHIGGFDDLNAANSSGKLQEVLNAEGVC
jgi:glutaredoxin 3